VVKPKLLGISGSLRKESYNTKLLHLAVEMFGPCDFTMGNIRFPLFDNDLQQSEGIPSGVQTLSDQIEAADAVIIASPEYNQSLPGVLKNALDWVSRTEGNPWKHKPVAIVNAAAGRTGGARSNYSLRLALAPFNTRLLQGPEVLVALARKEFDEDGKLENERYLKVLKTLMEDLRAEAQRT
jgi:chromate reductase